MPSIKLSEPEMMALFGLPHLAIVLYVLGLRPRMDFAQGTVGVRPLISWQALREAVYVEPHPGIKHEYPSGEAMRRAAVWLEKVGLIEMRSVAKQLIFYLPLADADYSARNKADRTPTGQADRTPTGAKPRQPCVTDDFIEQSRQVENEKADAHPVSGKPISIPPAPCLTGSREPEESAGAGGRALELIFPTTLSSQQRAAMASKLDGMTQTLAQAVIDELAAGIQAGTVKNSPALFRKLVDQARSGDFIPDQGERIRQGREGAARAAAQRQAAEERATIEAAQFVKGRGKPDNLRSLVKRRMA